MGGGGGSIGSVGATKLVAPNHRVRTERTAFCPTPGGSVELIQGDRPVYVGPRSRSDVAVVLTIFPPGSRPRAGRQRPTWLPGGVASRLMCPGRRLPPFATYIVCVRRTGERIRHGSRHRVASSRPPPRGVLPRPRQGTSKGERARVWVYGCTGKGYTGLPRARVAWGIACHACTDTQLLLEYTKHGFIRYLSGR